MSLGFLLIYFNGNDTKNVAPPPFVFSTPTFPCSILASSFAMLSPNPKCALSVWALSAQ